MTAGALALAATTLAGPANAEPSPPCAVAEAEVARLLDSAQPSRVVFGSPSEHSFSLSNRRWIAGATDDVVEQPPLALLEKATTNASVNAITACPNVQALLHARNVAFGDEAVRNATRASPPRAFGATVFNISLPATNDDASEWLIVIDQHNGPLNGVSAAYHRRRAPSGEWVTVGTTLLAIS